MLQMSGSRMKIDGRLKPCAHIGCCDIEVFLEMNQRSRKASPFINSLTFKFGVNCFLIYPRSCKCKYEKAPGSSDAHPKEKFKRDSLYINDQGKFKHFNHKKVSRKRGGSLRGQGWKYGSGFVDGIFPLLSPDAQQILNFMKKEMDLNRVCDALSSLPPTHTTWDDIISVAVQLRLNKRWDPIITGERGECHFIQVCRGDEHIHAIKKLKKCTW
ncbi:putative Zinc finger, MIZ-type, Zinc finger, RING/FYVE/PHD-type [Helianthus annuus]|uniref:Putative zinc finger, MIZ-type, E3 SUMO-protein ligase SIZ1, plant n=1 Tax=Helianthus annuus TaxID=4232 RepID=A0A251TI24_HELAN|nr:uncharacterized protein LOC110883857 isoform X3 [Helianthus annuus]KAF5784708.1 putative Zinc finger, MIZ-type, Zinc finger, RING/FYVE/PHD-type [Helianthus annuus]